MNLLHNIAYRMRKVPKIKAKLKNTYQHLGNVLSDKKTFPDDIIQVSSNEKEHLFGYYDKCPWNKDENKMIYMEVERANKDYASSKPSKIILKDLVSDEEKIIGETRCWNVQQGCMLQWLGPDFNTDVIYNDFIDGELKAIILNVNTLKKRIIDSPVYSVDAKGKYALTLDFYRLNRLRPGYGYNNKSDKTSKELIPSGYCIWKVDLINNKTTGIIKYSDLCMIDHKNTMDNAEHKVNHIMINPSGKRFMFLHRWIQNGVKYSRLLTSDDNGKNIYNLLDEDLVSHCNWKNNNTILGWARKEKEGTHYYLLKDQTKEYKIICKEKLLVDGHPSYSNDLKCFVTDTYPDFKRKQHLYLCYEDSDEVKEIASIYADTKYMNDCRCDLHPRFNYSCDKICFDGSQHGKREVYILNLKKGENECDKTVNSNKKVSIVVPIYNVEDYLDRCLCSIKKQSYSNIEVMMVDDCSPDNSSQIAKKYEKEDERFKYIKREKNGGLSAARNTGIKHVTGDYICFIDSDDWISENYVSHLLNSALINKSDIVICDYVMAYGDGSEKIANSLSIIESDASIENIIAYSRNHSVTKLFKRKFFFDKKIYFPEDIKRSEDISTIIPLLTHSSKISIVNEGLYYYYQREKSLSNDIDNSKIDLSFYDKTVNLMEKRSSSIFKEEIEYHSIIELMYGKVMLMVKHNYSNKEIKDFINSFSISHKDWIKNKYIKHMNRLKRIFIKQANKKRVLLLRLMVRASSHL